jgi:hypothetical protein
VKTCDISLLPYQYEVRSDNSHYFATLIPIEFKGNTQTFFLSENPRPLTNTKSLLGGDPAGWVVTFERTSKGVSVHELGLSLIINQQANKNNSDSSADEMDEILKFDTSGEQYSLVSCDGIFSKKFKSDFPNLFK